MRELIIVAHDIRSTHNVGSLLRTAEGLGVRRVIFSGYTPYPRVESDDRLPHISNKLHSQISKTALGAEEFVDIECSSDIITTLEKLKGDGYQLVALEQTADSISLPDFDPPQKLVILLGREV